MAPIDCARALPIWYNTRESTPVTLGEIFRRPEKGDPLKCIEIWGTLIRRTVVRHRLHLATYRTG